MKDAVKMYTNEITPEIEAFFKSPHTQEEWAAMDDEQRALWTTEAEKNASRTLEELWRLASEGPLTRDGGCVVPGSSSMVVTTESGEKVRIALVGDEVVYPDGTRTRIISGAGDCFRGDNRRSFALVGSQLENGDEIICTPQRAVTISRWNDSKPFPEDFLKPESIGVA